MCVHVDDPAPEVVRGPSLVANLASGVSSGTAWEPNSLCMYLRRGENATASRNMANMTRTIVAPEATLKLKES